MYLKILTFLGLTFLLGNVNPSRGSTEVSKNTNAWRLSHGLPPLPPRFAITRQAPSATTAKPSHTPHHLCWQRELPWICKFDANKRRPQWCKLRATFARPKGFGKRSICDDWYVLIRKVSFSNVVHPVNPNYGAASGKDFVTWSLNPSTKELQAQYVKLDGSKSRLFLALDADENELYFVRTTDSSQMINLYLCED
ncbi:hypothetical protein C8R43DRAFT_949648 [Mycena crocata]|nr:hypothetical protein C8R43DRAFT_949648 [Mycena crocata]